MTPNNMDLTVNANHLIKHELTWLQLLSPESLRKACWTLFAHWGAPLPQ
jgi:hypothetical protein